ncbi:hypothetical protein D9756_003958 [Leucocoprinus leucothites]|uniref:Uncharacterized protein n=1 Tax=Leucocoprinus leucothites TaxID=201217 RepID=A0A8H5G053_9AGAR|nr:hypothetical protein D9756_003958 [Leucoagaricus leucothites]
MASPEELHIQVEFPSPTHQESPWDSLRTLNRVAKSPFIRNPRNPDWAHRSDDLLVSATGHPYVDHDFLLPPKLLVSRPQSVHSLTQHPHGSDPSLKESEPDTDDERPQSPSGDFEDEYIEYATSDLSQEPGNCKGTLIECHTTGHPDNPELDGGAVPPSLTRPTRIRFRSRVRITSGLNRHRHSSIPGTESRTNTFRSTNGDTGYLYYTPSSSISGSPSSSISAPLRSRTDDEADRPGWGPLGQRVSMLAKKNRTIRRLGSTSDDDDDQPWALQSDSAEDLAASRGRVGLTEVSPLLMAHSKGRLGPRVRHHGRRRRRCYCVDCGLSPRRLTPEQVDEAFGKWPNRMLNYQWWWWQAETVICCRCLDESDDEYT